MKEQITYDIFDKVDIRIGTVVSVKKNEKARKPSLVVEVDFGDEIGIKKSSAQITDHYDPHNLIGIQVAAVINFPRKQIGPFMSECLVTGFTQPDGSVILATPNKEAVNGSRLA